VANGLASTAIGYQNYSEGSYTFAAGQGNIASGSYSAVFGKFNGGDANPQGEGQVVVGVSNASSPIEGAFIIGNGDYNSAQYSNLLVAGGTGSAGIVQITGSLNITGSATISNKLVLTAISTSLNFVDDAAAQTGGVPLGGLYRSGSFILIRLV
jgi:hypothetical protein